MELFLATIKLQISKTENIDFYLLPSADFTQQITRETHTFACHYQNVKTFQEPKGFIIKFSGISTDEELIPYNWTIASKNDQHLISIEFLNHPELRHIYSVISPSEKQISVHLVPHNSGILSVDPLIQPLGSLLMVYLANLGNAFLIHASGILDQNKGYIFSAVSGTGKSTMAKLWHQKGAEIINDDRLWIQKINDIWHMFNTPMVWYRQKPKMCPVHKILLISQSPENEVQIKKGLTASMQVMSNCIQHFHQKKMTDIHLKQVLDFTTETPIYVCGFKPDTSIVDLIRDLS